VEIAKVGVIGAGVMGRGVCVALCQAGLEVILVDRAEEILERSRGLLGDEARMYSILAPDSAITADEIMARTIFTTDYSELAHADLIIENVTEKWEVKEPVYERIGKICPADVIFGVNTSAIPVTRLGALTGRPENVIGVHFMNPVPLKPTVELIRGYHTSDSTVAAMRDFLSRMGKRSVLVNDSPGFVTNRVMMLTINEAVFLLQEGVAPAADIDRLFVECFGHAMGPLETADLIGLDTVLLSIEVLYRELKDGKFRPCPLLVKMVDAGRHGRKTGGGFYNYRS
jgi:3-hydroxybutyryl-CoA dehydrogenase